MLPALSDLSTTGKSTTRSLCSSISNKRGWRKLFAWIMRLTSIPQISDELHLFYFSLLLLLVRNHQRFLLKTLLQPQQGWLIISTLSGVERKRNSLSKLMEMWLRASLSAFSSCQANKAEGWEGEWQHKQWNSLRNSKLKRCSNWWKATRGGCSVLALLYQIRELRTGKICSLSMVHQGISRLQKHYCIFNNAGICLCPSWLTSM